MSSRVAAAAAVFAVTAVVFLASPVRQVSDSYYSLLLAQQIATRASFDLAPFVQGDPTPELAPGPLLNGLPYQLERQGERVLYGFPPGASLLAAPWMGIAAAAGDGVVDASGRYLPARELSHQRILAALLAALFAASGFLAFDRLLPRRPALVATAALALATPLWSTASRGLWSHTAELAIAGLALPILAERQLGSRAGGLRLGAIAAAAYYCRPTASIVLVVLFAMLALSDRAAARRFALGAAAVLALFVAQSRIVWGSWLPPYYLSTRLMVPTLDSILGSLLSPGRGLFVYEPALALALAFGLARRRELAARPLFVAGAAGLALHTAVVVSFPHWSGGYSYGPRLFTDTLFFQAMMVASVAATLVARSAADRGWRRVIAVLALWGVVVHGAGALSNQSNRWNWSPRPIDSSPERLWSWRDPQFLAWAIGGPRRGTVVAPAPKGDGVSQNRR